MLRLVNLQVLGAKEALGKEGLAVFGKAASRTPAPGSHQAVCSRGSSPCWRQPALGLCMERWLRSHACAE